MNIKQKLLVGLAAAAIGFGASGSATADPYGRDQRQYRHQHEYQRHQQYRHHYQHRKHDHHRRRYVVRERVLVERPVYVERYVRHAPPPRHPAVVFRVDFPSLVFGLH